MLLSVRGGGHHIAGNAVADGGLTIDLSAMRAVERRRRQAHGARRRRRAAHRLRRDGAGARPGDAARHQLDHRRRRPHARRRLRLADAPPRPDDRQPAERDASSRPTARCARHRRREEPELFWALRGGGGNFGVVTSFEFALHPVGPEVYAGLVVYPFAQARQVLRAWRDFSATAPDALSVWTVLRKAPPLPFLPESAHGTEVVIFPIVYAGDMEAGKRAAAPVERFGDPIARRARADAVRRLPGRLRSAAHARAVATTGSRTTSTA